MRKNESHDLPILIYHRTSPYSVHSNRAQWPAAGRLIRVRFFFGNNNNIVNNPAKQPCADECMFATPHNLR